MAQLLESHDIDLFGDVLLVLMNRDLDELQEPEGNEEQPDCCSSESDTNLDDASSINTITESILAQAAGIPGGNASPAAQRPERRAVRFRVSSEVLRRSSVVMKELLDEHIGYPGAGYLLHYPIRVPIWNDDPGVMSLLLRILHGDSPTSALQQDDVSRHFPNWARSPNKLDPHTLAHIATIVEKYQFHAALDNCLMEWMDMLEKQVDKSSWHDMVAWVWITWVFELKDYFEIATEQLAKTSTGFGDISDFRYPIPSRLLSM